LLLAAARREFLDAETRADRERAQPVGRAIERRDEIRKTAVRLACGTPRLLAQEMEALHDMPARLVGEHDDVIAVARRGMNGGNATRREDVLAQQAIEQRARILEQPARRLALLRVLKDAWPTAAHSPGMEERRPVDVVAHCRERNVEGAHTEMARHGRTIAFPVRAFRVRSRLGDGNEVILRRAPRVLFAQRLVFALEDRAAGLRFG